MIIITITSGQSNLTKGRIAAAHGRYTCVFSILYNEPPLLALKIAIPMGDVDPL